jgi:hypothetical protein
VKVPVVIVAASIARENVAVGVAEVATPVAPDAGVFAVTVGGVGPEGTTSIAVTSGSSTEPYTDLMDSVPFVTFTPETLRT